MQWTRNYMDFNILPTAQGHLRMSSEQACSQYDSTIMYKAALFLGYFLLSTPMKTQVSYSNSHLAHK